MKHNQTEKAERLFTALGDLDPKTVASAAAYKPQTTRKGRGRRILVAVLAATLCVCLVTQRHCNLFRHLISILVAKAQDMQAA